MFEGIFVSALGRAGNDLLSRALRHSTIGAEAFHGRVRDGIGWGRLAIITSPAQGRDKMIWIWFSLKPIRIAPNRARRGAKRARAAVGGKPTGASDKDEH